ncbi:MAG: DNA polymerase III subunit epsilon [Xanthomonadales bacterium]|nr:DNA polymerase III subunit epsilon [Xanthomonadales bacterium]
MNRQIVLDTETTGLEPSEGHRVIEIGAIELVDRKFTNQRFHFYLNPERTVEREALEVHGISNEFLADKPRFGDLADDFLAFIRGAELIIHNAEFDVGFLNHELSLLEVKKGLIDDHALRILDTLELARKTHPGMKNSLDALCKRYEVDNSQRDLHGALLDARLLGEVYLRMTGGQTALNLDVAADDRDALAIDLGQVSAPVRIHVRRASPDEETAHRQRLESIRKKTGKCVWLSEPEITEESEPAH